MVYFSPNSVPDSVNCPPPSKLSWPIPSIPNTIRKILTSLSSKGCLQNSKVLKREKCSQLEMIPPTCWEHFPSFSAFHMRMHLQYSILAFNIQYLVKPSTLVFWVYSPMFMCSTKVTGKQIEKKSEVLLNISYYFRSEKSVPFEAGWWRQERPLHAVGSSIQGDEG